MDWEAVDRMIDDFRDLMPPEPSALGLFIERHDWRPVWNLAREIQEAFRTVRYPTTELRQASWNRFFELRSEASQRADREREWVNIHSEKHRDDILFECRGLEYSRLTDMIFFFDPTTVEEMKEAGRRLGHAMSMLKEHKHKMLREHKQECFDRFQEIKESHEIFWEDYRKTRDLRRQEYLERRQATIAKIEANLEKNEDQLEKARAAPAHAEERIAQLREKIDSTNSEKWRDIWSGWLEEAERKAEDIEEHIERIRGWIDEGQRKLFDLNQ